MINCCENYSVVPHAKTALAVIFLLLASFAVAQAVDDQDEDGMLDSWEVRFKFDPDDPSDAAIDSDRDGLTNLEEHDLGTIPRRKDTDRDWLADGYEVNVLGTDPNNADTDGDHIQDFIEGVLGLDPTNMADGMDDLDGDGVANSYEALLGTGINDSLSTPSFVGNFFESFEVATLPSGWRTPTHSVQDWTQNCSPYYGFDGLCSRQAGTMKNRTGDSVISFAGNFRPGALSVSMSYATNGSVLVYVDGIRVMERKGFGVWESFEINLAAGGHDISFVHRNPDGSSGGTVIIDSMDYTEVSDLYSDAANARFCTDAQQFLAGTWLSPVVTIEPDFDAFVSSKVVPWHEVPGSYAGNDEPLTVRQLTTTGQNPNAGGAGFAQLISCKTKRFDALNFIYGPPDVAAAVGKGCRDVNMQTFERVIAAMTPAEILSITGTGDPDDIQRPVFAADKGGFLQEWVYDIAYMSGGDLHIQSRQLNAGLPPPSFPVDPRFTGVHYCHLIAPEYARGLLLGEIPVIDNAPAGRL